MEEFIKKLFDDNSTNFFDEMYVSSENDGRILTEAFKKKLGVANKNKELSRQKLEELQKTICNGNREMNDKLQLYLKDYIDNIEKENVLYITQYYRQRYERYYKTIY